jgi:hypothetical protein
MTWKGQHSGQGILTANPMERITGIFYRFIPELKTNLNLPQKQKCLERDKVTAITTLDFLKRVKMHLLHCNPYRGCCSYCSKLLHTAITPLCSYCSNFYYNYNSTFLKPNS